MKQHKQMMMKVSELKNLEKNARKHSPAQIQQIEESIRKFGFLSAIVIDKNNVVQAGNGRLMAATKLGMTEVPCIQANGLSKDELRAFALVDNRLSETSEWDLDILRMELEDLSFIDDLDLSIVGFSADEIESLLGLNLTPTETKVLNGDPDEIPENVKPICRLGDLWLLGEHRLLCGDSTSEHNLDRLMDGEKADLVFTDPPYNIASHGKNHGITELRGDSYGRLSESEWDKNFEIKNTFSIIERSISNVFSIYICTSHFILPDIIEWMKKFEYHNVCVWSKSNPMPSLSKRHWCWSHEFVAYATSKKHVFNYPQNGNAKSVWEIEKIPKAEFHPTQKPVAVPEHAILHSSNKGMMVLDLFGGSGTTMIACEKTERQCRMIEIDPGYCDVIIKRWEELTGNKAQLSKE